MTIKEAQDLGYEIIKASPFEVGLIKNGKGIRTWFISTFNGTLPTLQNPEVQRAIYITEENTIRHSKHIKD